MEKKKHASILLTLFLSLRWSGALTTASSARFSDSPSKTLLPAELVYPTGIATNHQEDMELL